MCCSSRGHRSSGCCHGHGHGSSQGHGHRGSVAGRKEFGRRFTTKEEKIEQIEEYISELKKEVNYPGASSGAFERLFDL